MPTAEQVHDLVRQIPDPAPDGRYTNLDDAKVAQLHKVVAQLRQGGGDSVRQLIDLLVAPGQGDDSKAHFALHLLAVAVTQPGQEPARAAFVQAVAGQLGSDRPKAVQAYLIEQLQLAGTRAAVSRRSARRSSIRTSATAPRGRWRRSAAARRNSCWRPSPRSQAAAA